MSKSIKPGRGPSAMGLVGSVVIGICGVFWTINSIMMEAPIFFIIFGILFVGVAISQGIYHYKNTRGKNRMSIYDITENDEEPDPMDRFVNTVQQHERHQFQENDTSNMSYCPYCGNKIENELYMYCSKCGKEIKK